MSQDLTIKEQLDQLKNKQVKASDLINESFKKIHENEKHIEAFITLNEEQAKLDAKKLDEQGFDEKYPLFGMPIGIKDNIVTKGLKTTAASQILANFDDPLYDATVVKKLKEAGAINVGKMNMDEFAMGSTTENSSFHVTKNPWNTDYVPGGSSGGSAAAVAAGMVPFALGTDTGGSVRQPAAFCGVVGMKPTYGRVSRFGLIAYASSLDQVGPLTRTVEDNARVLEVISGYDEMDLSSAPVDVPKFTDALTGDVAGLKIAVPKEYFQDGFDEDVKESVKHALKLLEDLGATWEEVSLPHLKYAASAYYIIAASEASSNLARFDGVRYGKRSENANNMLEMYTKSRSEGFGEEVKRRIILGTFAMSSDFYEDYYKKALQVRTLIKQDFENVLSEYDCIIGPTTPSTAYKFGEKSKDPLRMYASDLTTVPVNLAGLPAISVPAGFHNDNNMPIGMQIIGRPFDESTVYRVAHAYEQETGFYKEKPQIGGAKS